MDAQPTPAIALRCHHAIFRLHSQEVQNAVKEVRLVGGAIYLKIRSEIITS